MDKYAVYANSVVNGTFLVANIECDAETGWQFNDMTRCHIFMQNGKVGFQISENVFAYAILQEEAQ